MGLTAGPRVTKCWLYMVIASFSLFAYLPLGERSPQPHTSTMMSVLTNGPRTVETLDCKSIFYLPDSDVVSQLPVSFANLGVVLEASSLCTTCWGLFLLTKVQCTHFAFSLHFTHKVKLSSGSQTPLPRSNYPQRRLKNASKGHISTVVLLMLCYLSERKFPCPLVYPPPPHPLTSLRTNQLKGLPVILCLVS